MDDQAEKNLFLSWNNYYQDKNMDELRQTQALILTIELEETRRKAQEEIKLRDQQISNLKELLTSVIKERDEAQISCQKAFLEKLLLQQELQKYPPQQQQQHSGISSIEVEDHHHHHQNHNSSKIGVPFDSSNNGSDCDESIVSSPHHQTTQTVTQNAKSQELPVTLTKPLPEKGKLLEAVMKAGPLLQTLLLAGPLPQWRHPPPPLETYQIPPPPVTICQDGSGMKMSNCGVKRGLEDQCNVSASEYKYQRIVLQ